jgi:hypothetical protein
MKVKLFFLYLALAFLSAEVFANGIDGFDGFKWGTTKSEIMQARGDEPIIWGDFEAMSSRMDAMKSMRRGQVLVCLAAEPTFWKQHQQMISTPSQAFSGANMARTA